MDFIRNLFTLFQRLQAIVRDGQKRRDLPGMVMALFGETFGGGNDADGQGEGPAVYQGARAQADQSKPEMASRATARNKASRNDDLPQPAVYRSADGADPLAGLESARAPARNADDRDERFPEPASATPLQREDYDYQPASADPADEPAEPAFEPASASGSPAIEEPVTASAAVAWDDESDGGEAVAEDAADESSPAKASPEPALPETPEPASEAPAPADGDDEEDDNMFDLDNWQETALKVAGVGAAAAATAAGAMAIKDRFFDGDDEDDGDAEKPAIPLGQGDEAVFEDDQDGAAGWTAATAATAPLAAAAAMPATGANNEDASQQTAPAQPRRPHPVEIIPADPRNPATQPASQTLANPGIRLYGTLDAKMYAEFTEMLAEQTPGGPIVIALTTMEGDPEIARSMADDIRLLRDRGRREIIFLGKTAVYGAGVLFMAAFPVSHRYLTRATKVLVTENKRAQPLELAGGSLRSVASQLEHAQREIQREIAQEDEDYRAISEGSNVSIQELREKAPHDWYITASEAKAMGLIAEVV
ncbi:ATP-dependent Clp protease proteolytic subunit [Alteriqipengyuania sp.]|uniref:ATP-dependent Clp protease proteolytic subunit n=2 Tax=Alteriqipengyuania sp. TaxID=2800692 RepID=UPI0035165112